MATRKVKIHEKTGSNTTDILYPQTSADIVDFAGGSDTGHLTSTNAQDAIKEVNTKVVNIGSSVVNTLNGKKSDVTLLGGNNITITPDASSSTNEITISTDAEVNQNAFGKFQTNSDTEVTAGSKTATLKFVDGTNIDVETTSNNEIKVSTTNKVITNNNDGVSDNLAKFNGTNTITNGPAYGTTGANKLLQLDASGKVTLSTLPDAILGQLVYGGNVTGAGVATLSTNAQTKLGTSSSSITLTNDTTAVTGYVANEGIFYVVSSDGNFASLGLLTGDWLISTGSAWTKIDNTDAVTGVKGDKESSYRIGNVNLTPANIGALPDTTHIPNDPNNATITLQRNGTTVGDFTTDQSSAETIDVGNYIGGDDSASATDLVALGYGEYVWKAGKYIKIGTGTKRNQTNSDAPVIFYDSGTYYGFLSTLGADGSATGGYMLSRLYKSDGSVYSAGQLNPLRFNGSYPSFNDMFYAPTTAGTSGQYLKSSGSGAPVWDNLPTTENLIDKFFTDNPSFVYNDTKMYLHDIAGKSLTDADVQAYLTALNTKYGNFINTSVSLIPYTSTMWAVLQRNYPQTYTLYYVLPDQDAIWHLSPNSSYVFVETLDGWLSDITFKANKSTTTTAGTYSAVDVNSDGIVTGGYQSLEYGANVGDSTPSANLVEGGLFFEKLS